MLGRLISCIVIIASLGGCQAAGWTALYGANGISMFGHYSKTADLAYGPGPVHKLDIYSPKPSGSIERPVVVFFHGGDWSESRPGKEIYRFVGDALTEQGFVVVVPNYRRYPHAKFPDFVEDAAAAVVWAHENIERYGGSPKRIFVMGHSAGAHLAAMIITDRHYMLDAGGRPEWIIGMVGLGGPYSFLPMPDEPLLRAIFDPPSQYPLTQPVNFVRGGEPPMLLISGGRDNRVGGENMARMAARVREVGGQVKTITYENLGHIMLVGSLAPLVRWNSPEIHDIAQFLHEAAIDPHGGNAGPTELATQPHDK